MVLEERIRKWQQGVLDSYCSKCSDTCCNSKKHNITVDDSSLPLFQEKGIPFVGIRDLDLQSLRTHVLLLKNGRAITKPSIVQVPKKEYAGTELYLYANSCPFYKDNQCEVHEDPRRPDVCKMYPIVFLGGNYSEEGFLELKIKDSCECFNREEIRSELTKNFHVRIVKQN
jgi:Fe-S-cluster containining protein